MGQSRLCMILGKGLKGGRASKKRSFSMCRLTQPAGRLHLPSRSLPLEVS